MKINWHLVNYDLLDELSIPQCPSLFRVQAESIIRLVSEMEPFSYNKISQFDKHLIIEYWRAYDGLSKALAEPSIFKDWFVNTATNPELIRRARQWLVEKNYLIPPQGVEDRAQESGERWGKAVKAG